MAETLLAEYVRVSRDFPCPICAKPDWCLVARDGRTAICQRTESPTTWQGKRGSRVGYLHEITGPITVPETTSQAKPKLCSSTVAQLVKAWVDHPEIDRRLDDLAADLGVSAWSLDLLSTGWRGDAYCCPMRDGDWNFVGVRFRGVGVFGGKRKWSLSGGREGVFAPKLTKSRRQMFVVEGHSDCAMLWTHDLPAIGRPNRCAAWDHVEAILAKCQAEDVVLVSDADPDGRRDTMQLETQLAKVFPQVRSIVPTNRKDAREVFAAGGTSAELLGALHTDNHLWRRLECH